MILDQTEIDYALSLLLTKVSEVYVFIMEAQELAKDLPMLGIYGKIARQILECADFIAHYSETKSACESAPSCRYSILNSAQGKDLASTFSKKQMPLFGATLTFSIISCNNSGIERFVTSSSIQVRAASNSH
jgi:hypothetical protein